MPKCTAQRRADGQRCKANAKGETQFCRWHSQTPEDIAAHATQSSVGGYSRAAKLFGVDHATDALEGDLALAAIDLGSATGIKELTTATLRALMKLPMSVRVATCIGYLVTTQRTNVVEANHEARMAAIERRLNEQDQRQQ